MRAYVAMSCFIFLTATTAFSESLPGRVVEVYKVNGGYDLKDKTTYLGQWLFAPMLSIPALKLKQSTKENTEYDTSILAGVGGGISFNHTVIDITDPSKINSNFSVSLFGVVSTIEKSDEANKLATSVGFSIGLLNNNFMLGFGRDLGETTEKERNFFLIGFGANFLSAKVTDNTK